VTMHELEARWQTLWASAASAEAGEIGQRILDAYGQPHRAYHNLEHLVECLAELDSVSDLAQRPSEVELALWFHDVVYKPLSSKNEEASAAWARKEMDGGGVDGQVIDRVVALILATRHNSVLDDPDQCLVADIDLAVFGRDRAGYASYEEGVRQEYCWVPGATFRKRRAERLKVFLLRPKIYYTSELGHRYEEQARKNLAAAVRKLSR